MAKLVLVDAYSIVFRAFYSVPPLTRTDGTPVGAVYGFMNILINLINRLQPDYLVVAFDAGGETFRHEEYREYKANRLEAPAELKPQFSIVREAVEAMNICRLERRGYEADDIIATLVKRYQQEANLNIIIASGDKDLMQLVTDNVQMYDGHKEQLFGVTEVTQKFGVAQPTQILDVLALMGDNADNVPGVPGIGPKGAAELISRFGSLEGLYQHLDELPKNKRLEKLIQYREQAFLSKTLVKLADQMELQVSLEDFTRKIADPQVLLKFLYQQNFRSLAQRVERDFHTTLDAATLESISHHGVVLPTQDLFTATATETAIDLTTLTPPVAQVINSVDALEKLQAKIIYQGECYIEAFFQNIRSINGIAPLQALSITLATRETFYITIQHTDANAGEGKDLLALLEVKTTPINGLNETAVLAILGEVFGDRSVVKIGYDLKRLYKYLLSHNLSLVAYHDLLTMFYLLEAGRQRFHYFSDFYKFLLDTQAIQTSNAEALLELFITAEKAHDLTELLQQQQWSYENYLALRNEVLMDGYQILQRRLLREHLLNHYYTIERPLLPVLAKMESNGITIDPLKLKVLSDEFAAKAQELEQLIFQEAGEEFNIGSPKQLGQILFTKLNVPQLHKAKKDKNPGTSSDILEELAAMGYDIAEHIIQWRKVNKLKSTYTDPIAAQLDPYTSKIHTTFDATATNSGRLASNSPNLQNIPIRGEDGARIREAFIASKGCKLIDIDYSQIELRVMAHMAKVKELQASFRQHEDIHTRTASQIFGVPLAEVTSVMRRQAKAINFGIIYGISSFGLAKQIGMSNGEAARYINSYFEHYPEILRFTEKCIAHAKECGYVTTLFGHRCFLPEINSTNGEIRRFAERVAVNAPIQGTAADIIKKAMIRLDEAISRQYPQVKILLQIHDELVLECPIELTDAIQQLSQQIMEKIVWLEVPLEAEAHAGDNWLQAH